ncbi:MAG: right-handed parallel beta-helix repeat-containing protein [Myxococcales bacterium]|nr:right-handed parallel beta-helix repeat-containing protein [Myxococcales bacterium]
MKRLLPTLTLLCFATLLAPGCSDSSPGPDGDASRADGGVDGPRDDVLRPDGPQPDTQPDATPSGCGIQTFASGKQPQNEIHVAQNGSDQNGDGSATKPYASIGEAVKHATPGSAIRVHSGTYSGGVSISGLAGTAAAPIWIGGAPGETKPVLQGGGEALHLTKVRYLVVHDLEVSGSTANGINCDDGGDYADPEATRWIVFQGLDIHDIGGSGNQDCLKLSGLDDFWVLDSTFKRCGGGMSGSGIDHVGCHKGVIARNRFEQTSGNGVQAKGGSVDIDIKNNWFEDAGERSVNMGGSTGLTFFRPPLSQSADNAEAINIRVLANVFVGSTVPFAFVGCDSCLAAHNTIVSPTKWLLRILQETTTGGGYTFVPARKGLLYNNIFYFARADVATAINIGPDTDANSFGFEHNTWYAHDAPPQDSTPNFPVSTTGTTAGIDPEFVDVQSGNFKLKPSSKVIGYGSNRDIGLGPLSDMEGNCFDTTMPTAGAYAVAP